MTNWLVCSLVLCENKVLILKMLIFDKIYKQKNSMDLRRPITRINILHCINLNYFAVRIVFLLNIPKHIILAPSKAKEPGSLTDIDGVVIQVYVTSYLP